MFHDNDLPIVIGAMSGPGFIVSIVKAWPASGVSRQMAAMQKIRSPVL